MPNVASRPMAKRKGLVFIAWLVVFMPLAAAVSYTVRPAASLFMLEERAALNLAPPIVNLAVGADRIGDHAAILDGGGGIHVLGLRRGRFVVQVNRIPWQDADLRRVRAVFLDTDRDDLTELLAVRIPRPTADARSPFDENAPWETAVYRQEGGRFRLTETGPRPHYRPPGPGAADLVAGGVAYGFRDLRQYGDPVVLTQLVELHSGRAAFALTGERFQVLDIDGDGEDDLITVEPVANAHDVIRYRLYVYRAGQFIEAWTAAYDQIDQPSRLHRFTRAADLDGDGCLELIVCEPRSGRVTVLEVRPEARQNSNRQPSR